MLECVNLFKKYKQNVVVSDLSFKVKQGEVFGLLGVNGAGKTTTIKMILGLTKITSGEVRIKEGITIGYSPETPYFHPFLTGGEVLKFYSKLQKIPKKQAVEQIEEILLRVGLKNKANNKVKNYSKGMLQRLAVAQSLLGKPDLLILDEPTSGLDALGRIQMKNLIEELKKEGRTIILNSHILTDVESVAERVMIINDGIKIIEMDLKNTETDLENTFIKAVGGCKNANTGS